MKKRVCLYLILFLICCSSFGCSGVGADGQATTISQPTATPEVQKTQVRQGDVECVRAKPEPVIKTSMFPGATFRLEKNKDAPYQDIGYETVQFDNGDELEIENTGCENYTLIFKIRTKRFAKSPDNTRYWYKKAVELLNFVKAGIDDEDSQLLKRGITALKSYAAENSLPKYGETLDFGKGEIGQSITFEKVTLLTSGFYELEVSIGIGPL